MGIPRLWLEVSLNYWYIQLSLASTAKILNYVALWYQCLIWSVSSSIKVLAIPIFVLGSCLKIMLRKLPHSPGKILEQPKEKGKFRKWFVILKFNDCQTFRQDNDI